MTVTTYDTAGGIRVHRTVEEIPIASVIEPVVQALDAHRGVLLASSYEYPGRYTRWDMGFVDPPLELTSRGAAVRVSALNDRGRVLLPAVAGALAALPAVTWTERTDTTLAGEIAPPTQRFAEEDRSKQTSVFTILRAVRDPAVRAVSPASRAQPRAVRVPLQPGRRRVSGRRLARDVRAGRRRSCGDVPDLGDDRAGRRSAGRRRADPAAAQLREGR